LESSTTATETDESTTGEFTEWGSDATYSAPSDAILVYITLDLDYSVVADDIDDRAAWVTQLIADLCYALDLDTDRVEILQVEPGSIKIIVAILPDTTGEDDRTLDEIIADLEEQIADPSSKLLEGVITSHTDTSVTITVIEPTTSYNETTSSSETEGTTSSSESSSETSSESTEESTGSSSEESLTGESAAFHSSAPSIASIVLFAITAVLAHRNAL